MEYKIKQAAELAGIGEHTLRYYEKEGLLHISRNQSGVRLYSESDIFWLQLIKCLRETGMSISDLREMVKLSAEGKNTLAQRIDILKRHRAKVEGQMQELQRCIEKIDRKLQWYENPEAHC